MSKVRKKRMSVAERRVEYLKVTGDLVAEGGVQAVTMERLAALTNSNKATVYRCFDNRDHLLSEVLRAEYSAMTDLSISGFALGTTIEDQLRLVVLAWLNAFSSRGRVVEEILAARPTTEIVEQGEKVREESIVFWAAYITEQFDVDHERATMVASMMFAALDGATVAVREFGYDPEWVAAIFAEFTMAGIDGLVKKR